MDLGTGHATHIQVWAKQGSCKTQSWHTAKDLRAALGLRFSSVPVLLPKIPQVGKINVISISPETEHEDIHTHHCHMGVPGKCHRDGERTWKGASEGPKISTQIQKLLVLSDLEFNEHQSDLS